ncbi:hypothetical protein LINGRAHAP2_LOCUS11435 [Linum grandiflorum]
MDDCNLMAAECMVVSCCSCQCLLLQFLIFLFLKLPRRMLHAAMQRIKMVIDVPELARNNGETYAKMYNTQESMCIDIGGTGTDHDSSKLNIVDDDLDGKKNCIEEIERVLEDYYAKGEFGFGSFWRKEVFFQMTTSSRPSHNSSFSSLESSSTANKKRKKRLGLEVVQFELVEIVHSLSSYSSYGSCKDIDGLLDFDSSPRIWKDLRQ